MVLLLQERAPAMLCAKDGGVSLSWISDKEAVLKHCQVTAAELNAHVRSWPRSKQGKELLEELRWVGEWVGVVC